LSRVNLSVFVPLNAGGHRVHVFTLETRQGIAWVKRNVGELVAQIMPGVRYDALGITPSVEAVA
jgi:hypothetical protein